MKEACKICHVLEAKSKDVNTLVILFWRVKKPSSLDDEAGYFCVEFSSHAYIYIYIYRKLLKLKKYLQARISGADLRNLCRYAKSCSKKKFPRAFSCCRGRSPF